MESSQSRDDVLKGPLILRIWSNGWGRAMKPLKEECTRKQVQMAMAEENVDFKYISKIKIAINSKRQREEGRTDVLLSS